MFIDQRQVASQVASFIAEDLFVERFGCVYSSFLVEVLYSIDHLLDVVAVGSIIVSPFAIFVGIVLKIEPQPLIVLFSYGQNDDINLAFSEFSSARSDEKFSTKPCLL